MTTSNLTTERTTNELGGGPGAISGSPVRPAGLTERMAATSARRPGRTLGMWVLAVLISLAFASAMHGLTSDAHVVGSTESSRAEALYAQVNRGSAARVPTDAIVVHSDRTTAADPSFDAAVTGLASRVHDLPGITAVQADLTRGSPLVSSTGHAAIIELHAASDADIVPVVHAVQSANGVDGLSVSITGQRTVDNDVSTLASTDLRNGEIDFGLPIALVVLLLVFGAVVAGLLPLLMAILSIAVGMGLASLVSQEFQLSTFIVNMMTAMGLALGIGLLALHRLPVPRGAPPGLRQGRGHPADRGDGGSRRSVQRQHLHRGAVGPVRRSDERDEEPGRRGHHRRDRLRGCRPHPAARHAVAAR